MNHCHLSSLESDWASDQDQFFSVVALESSWVIGVPYHVDQDQLVASLSWILHQDTWTGLYVKAFPSIQLMPDSPQDLEVHDLGTSADHQVNHYATSQHQKPH